MDIAASGTAIIMVPKRRTLATLPEPSWSLFGDRPPWRIVSAAVLADLLDLDHGLLAVWRQRRLGPQALPTNWFRGHCHGYRVADLYRWLANRQGLPEPNNEELARRWFLSTGHRLDEMFDDDFPISWWVEMLSRDDKPEGLKLTPTGRTDTARWLI